MLQRIRVCKRQKGRESYHYGKLTRQVEIKKKSLFNFRKVIHDMTNYSTPEK